LKINRAMPLGITVSGAARLWCFFVKKRDAAPWDGTSYWGTVHNVEEKQRARLQAR